MNSRSDDQTITRRKFRKGTHSCSECRRRKVKCVFSTPDSTTCVVCLRRETHCFSQAESPVSAILDGASPGVEVDHRLPPRALSSAMSNFAVPPYTTSVSYASMPLAHAHTTSLQYDLLGNQPGRTSIPRDSVLTASATSTGQSQHTAAGMTVHLLKLTNNLTLRMSRRLWPHQHQHRSRWVNRRSEMHRTPYLRTLQCRILQ
jgi:hypothetical protein